MALFSPGQKQIKTAFLELQRLLEDVGIETASLDGRLLIQHVCGLDHTGFIAATQSELTTSELLELEAVAQRRLHREPISRIIGEAEFWSLPFYLSKDTLDPRADTETMIELVLEQLGDRCGDALRLLDLGTGTGCIALSLLYELPMAKGVGVDISAGALATAWRNAKRLDEYQSAAKINQQKGESASFKNELGPNIKLSDRVHFLQGSWFAPVSGQFDVIVSNPPYIARDEIKGLSPEVAVFDPLLALDGGENGLDPYFLIFQQANEYIADGGLLVLEFGLGQETAIINLLETSPLYERVKEVSLHVDLSGIIRCICARF